MFLFLLLGFFLRTNSIRSNRFLILANEKYFGDLGKFLVRVGVCYSNLKKEKLNQVLKIGKKI